MDLAKYQRSNKAGIVFGLVVLFVASTFLLSTDDSLKIVSMNASSIVSMLMVVVFLLNVFVKGTFVFKRNLLQKPLLFLFLCAGLSLLISKIDPSKAIPKEAYLYAWTKGLNSVDWRGLSFLARLFLSIFAIEFIVAGVNTRVKYFRVVNITILFYCIVCLFGLVQIILFGLFHIEIGSITITPGVQNLFRIGGYVGEPQTFGLILVSGYFLLLAAIKKRYREIWFSRQLLGVVFVIATVDLIFTFSVAVIVAVLLSLGFAFRRYFRKRQVIVGLIICMTVVIGFYGVFNSIIFAKLIHELSTINERTITWRIGYEMIRHNLLTGVGIGQSPLVNSAYIPATIRGKFDSLLLFDIIRQPPMNSYIEWIAETGLIGLASLLYVIYKIYRLGAGKNSECGEIVSVGYGVTLLALAIAANSSSGNFYIGLFNLVLAMYAVGMQLNNDQKLPKGLTVGDERDGNMCRGS